MLALERCSAAKIPTLVTSNLQITAIYARVFELMYLNDIGEYMAASRQALKSNQASLTDAVLSIVVTGQVIYLFGTASSHG